MTSPAQATSLPPADAIEVSIYEPPLPVFVEGELARLYKNIFSSADQFRILGRLGDASAYVVREQAQVTCLWLFYAERGAVFVLNRAIAARQDDIERFANTIFGKYPWVSYILIDGISAAISRIAFPYQQFNCLEDIVVQLPATAEAFFAALGKNMRASIKRYRKKIESELPSFRFEVFEKNRVSPAHIAEIVALSTARISSKRQVSTHTELKTEQLIRLVKSFGTVLVATVDGRVCAGVICTNFHGNFFMHVVAHDPAYDDYRIGKVCCYLSICDAIERAANEYHFLWGRYEYKYRLLGIQRDFDRLVVYRSFPRLLLSPKVFLRTAWRGYGRQAKHWLNDPKRKDSYLSRSFRAVWQHLEQRLKYRRQR